MLKDTIVLQYSKIHFNCNESVWLCTSPFKKKNRTLVFRMNSETEKHCLSISSVTSTDID